MTIDQLINRWIQLNQYRGRGSCYSTQEIKMYKTLMAESFPAIFTALCKDPNGEEFKALIEEMGRYKHSRRDPYYNVPAYADVVDFHTSFLKTIQKEPVYDEEGLLVIKSNKRGIADYHVNVKTFDGIEPERIVPTQDLSRFEIVTFGPYDWIVLAKQDGKMLLLSKNAVTKQVYESGSNTMFWERCTLRIWLNQSFINEFSYIDRQRILLTDVENEKVAHLGGKPTQDYVFLLSLTEVGIYFRSKSERILADKNCWWLRTVENFIPYQVWPDGKVVCRINQNAELAGIRPAMWVRLKERV